MKLKLTASLALFLALACVPPWAAAEDLQTIKVAPGDTLWSISQKYLKDPKRWHILLKHNTLPTSDPTVALPGMPLKVPRSEVKEKFLAATLVEAVGGVFFRLAGKPDWASANKGIELFNGDGLRTRDRSWARVTFFSGALLSLSPNSMAILMAPRQADHDLELKLGAAHAVSAKLQTPSARIVPKQDGTKYTARVLDDLSTRVQVYKGQAEVQDIKGMKAVLVNAGFATEVKLDRVPTAPVRVPNLDNGLDSEISGINEARIESLVQVRRGAPAPSSALNAQLVELAVGLPVAAFHIQVGDSARFGKILFEKQFDAYEPIDLNQAGLTKGVYWIRVSVIDLLGEKGKFSNPIRHRIGPAPEEENFVGLGFQGKVEIIRPREDNERAGVSSYRIMGQADPELRVSINGQSMPKDGDGAFFYDVRLQRGPNTFRIQAADVRGNDKVITRTIIFDP